MLKKKKLFINLLLYIIGVAIAFVFIFPILILAINSFKTLKEIYINVLALPNNFSFNNYFEAYKKLDFFRSVCNSLIITISATILVILFCSMAGWVLVRYKSKTSTIIFMVFACAMLIPFQCVMLPLIELMGKLHMMNRHGLILINVGFASSLSIMLYHGFFKNIPVELEEAAAIDGSSQIYTFFKIVMPLTKGISATVAILNVISLWNDYLLPSLTINKSGMQTLPLKTYLFFGQYTKQWNLGTTALVIAMVPIIIFYLLCQKYIIKGVVAGAVKG